jgi:hypothetical protein
MILVFFIVPKKCYFIKKGEADVPKYFTHDNLQETIKLIADIDIERPILIM